MLRCSSKALLPRATSTAFPRTSTSYMHRSLPRTIAPTTTLQAISPRPTPIFISPRVSHDNTEQRGSQKLQSLRSFLASSQTDTSITPNTIRSLYTSIEARSEQHHLSSEEYASLLKIFGTLSSSTPSHDNQFLHTSAFTKYHRGRRFYWSFVLKLAAQKQRVVGALADSDKYWIMVAYLSMLGESSNGFPHMLSKVTKYYEELAWRYSIPDIHLPYLQALVSSNVAQHHRLAGRAILCLVKQHSLPQPVATFMWECILTRSHVFSSTMKESLLSILVPIHEGCEIVREEGHLIASALTTLLASPGAPSVADWAYEMLSSPTSSTRPLQTRWNELQSLSCAFMSQTLANLPFLTPPEPPSSPHTNVDWKTVCLLTHLEGRSRVPHSAHSSTEELGKDLRAIWKEWAFSSSHRPFHVTIAIVGGFLRVATNVADPQLVDACGFYSTKHGLWDSREIPDRSSSAQYLLSDFLVSSALTKGSGWRQLLEAGRSSIDGEDMEQAMNRTLDRLMTLDTHIAASVYRVARANGVEFSAATRVQCALSQAGLGNCEEALHLLQVEELNMSQLVALWKACIAPYQQRNCQKLDCTVHRCLQVALLRTQQNHDELPVTLRRSVEYFLSISLPKHAVQLATAVLQASPTYLRPSAYYRLHTSFVNRGHHQQALRLSRAMAVAGLPLPLQEHARLLSPPLEGLNTANAHSASVTPLPPVGYSSITWKNAHSRQQLYADQPFSAIIAACNGDIGFIATALTDCVREGNVSVAVSFFSKVHSDLDPPTRTRFGNILLRASSRPAQIQFPRMKKPTNGRLVRQTLSMLGYLRDKCGFRQDSVTRNIILEALLRWHTVMDSGRVRALFRGTMQQAMGNRPGTSFSRHTRPMYKLFIRAFRQRQDTSRARSVIAMLKSEQRQHRNRMEDWSLARSLGRRHRAGRVSNGSGHT